MLAADSLWILRRLHQRSYVLATILHATTPLVADTRATAWALGREGDRHPNFSYRTVALPGWYYFDCYLVNSRNLGFTGIRLNSLGKPKSTRSCVAELLQQESGRSLQICPSRPPLLAASHRIDRYLDATTVCGQAGILCFACQSLQDGIDCSAQD